MAFSEDVAAVEAVVRTDPSFAGVDVAGWLSDMWAAQDKDAFLLAAMRLMACAGNGHSRIIPNPAIRVWPVRILARGDGYLLVRDGQATPLETVNGAPPAVLIDRFRPWLAGTPARQSVIGSVLLAWPAALGAETVIYGTAEGALRLDTSTLVPALPLYPTSESGMGDPQDDDWGGATPVAWADDLWRVRIARLDQPLPFGMAEVVLTRPDAPILFDLRGNTGGDFTRVLPLITALQKQWRGTRCAVCVDRFTFSAAIVAAVLMQDRLGARLFGEAMGDGLRFWAEGDTVIMPQTRAHLRWSSAWHDWETGTPDATTPPEIAQYMCATGPLRVTPSVGDAAAVAWVRT